MVNEKLGRLQVVEKVPAPAGKSSKRGPYYRCVCECGNAQYIATSSDLRSGKIKSCGCWRKSRCRSSKAYIDITYSPAWESFENFYKDMGECPAELTLDRKDTRLGYYKENCRWATHQEQCQNRISSGPQSRIAGLILYRKSHYA